MSSRKVLLSSLLFGVTFMGGMWGVMKMKQKKKKRDVSQTTDISWDDLPNEMRRMEIFSEIAAVYDRILNFVEWFLRMGRHRGRLLAQAKGRVLEVACGTGRNLKYYQTGEENENGISEVFFVDKCPAMIDQMRAKQILKKDAFKQCIVSDVTDLLFADDTFDTVVDTFGLCSFEHPEQAIDEMVRVAKPGAHILLLEHGISSWAVVRRWQDKKLAQHVHGWGCYFNRDIEGYVRGREDVEVEVMERKHLGTTYVVRLRKKGEGDGDDDAGGNGC